MVGGKMKFRTELIWNHLDPKGHTKETISNKFGERRKFVTTHNHFDILCVKLLHGFWNYLRKKTPAVLYSFGPMVGAIDADDMQHSDLKKIFETTKI